MITLYSRSETLIFLFGNYIPFEYFQIELCNSLMSQRLFMRKEHLKISKLGFTDGRLVEKIRV